MVAAVNPCGFSLLPAYVSLFVGSAAEESAVEKRLLKAVKSGLFVTAGFVAVFATAGIVLDRFSSGLQQRLPLVTMVTGTLIFLAGVAVFFGRKLALPAIIRGGKTRNSSLRAMVGFGMTYAVSSLSCTIGPFLAIAAVGRRRSALSGLLTYGAYAAGMGVVVSALAIGSAIAKPAGPFFRRISRYSAKIGGVLMMFSGLYAIWYARWELRVFAGKLETDGLITTIDTKRSIISNFLADQGLVRIMAVLALASLGAVTIQRLLQRPNQSVEQELPETTLPPNQQQLVP